MSNYSSLPRPQEISVAFDVGHLSTSLCTMEVRGASVVSTDGGQIGGQPLVGYGAVASVMERQLRDQAGPYRGRVIQRDGYLELEAIWDEDRLIDSEGADLADCRDEDEES